MQENQFKQIKFNNQNQKTMEKEIKYIAPQAEILSAQVERGFIGSDAGSGDFGSGPSIPGL